MKRNNHIDKSYFMNDINYPITKINSKTWVDEEDLFPLFNCYMYSSKESIYIDYFHNKEFVDCKGDIYIIIDRIPPVGFWRNFLSFLPNVYREKLIFKKTNKKIQLEELKKDLIQGIRRFDSDATRKESDEWIMEIKKATNFKEVLCGID